MTNRPLAVITGASGGLGHEFARLFAHGGYDLVLVARNGDKLKQVAEECEREYKVKAQMIETDLSSRTEVKRLADSLDSLEPEVLVNNAGFATYGFFHELDLSKEMEMVEVNISTLTYLTHRVAGGMVKRKKGKILNVASTAAFQPGPLMAVYYASKSYVLSFSEALSNELATFGVTVTALCPGPTKTGFEKRAHLEASRLFKGELLDPAMVAKEGYEGLMNGSPTVIPTLRNKVLTAFARLVPGNVAAKIVRSMQDPLTKE